MPQIQTATCAVVNGNATVTASAGNDWSAATLGSLFSVVGVGVLYAIAAVRAPGVNVSGRWEIDLAAPYAGTTAGAAAYLIAVDFTPTAHLPLITPGDTNTAGLFSRAMALIDQAITLLSAGGVKVVANGAALAAAVPDYAGQLMVALDGGVGIPRTKAAGHHNDAIVFQGVVYGSELRTFGGGEVTAGRVNCTATAQIEHFLTATGLYLDNVLGLKNSTVSLSNPVTAVADAAADTLTAAGHGLLAGSAIRVLSTGTLPAPLVGGTDYYVRDVTTNTFKLAATLGGAALNLTTAGTGALSFVAVSRGYSAIDFFRHDDATSCAAIGINKSGYKLLQNRFYIATNTTDVDPTKPPPDISLHQHQGPAAEAHARILLDGTAHTLTIFGWDETNISVFGPAALLALPTGALVLRAPAAAEADGNLFASSVHFYLDEGGNNLKVKAKYAGGTVKTGTVALV